MAISLEVKEKAVALRTEGKKYKDIATTLGISVDWCKRSLSHIPQKQISTGWVEEVISLATRATGITPVEIYGILNKHNQRLTLEHVRATCIELDTSCIFRPDWIDKDEYHTSVSLMYSLADDLHNIVVDKVHEYLLQYPHMDRKNIQRTLVRLAGVRGNNNYSEFKHIEQLLEAIDTKLK